VVRRTKADALATKSELLDAAERLFSAQGVSNTSMMQVAEAAGVTRGAIYHHFDNKLDLMDSMMERVRLPFDQMLEQTSQRHLDNPLALLRARLLNIVELLQRDPHTQSVINILFHKCEYVDETLPIHFRHLRARNNCVDECTVLLQQAIERGQMPASANPAQIVVGMVAMIDGIIYNWLLDPDYFNVIEAAEQALDTFILGLQHRTSA
jgi:TetR/AcrR family acrAB operon transcriptional repressor